MRICEDQRRKIPREREGRDRERGLYLEEDRVRERIRRTGKWN